MNASLISSSLAFVLIQAPIDIVRRTGAQARGRRRGAVYVQADRQRGECAVQKYLNSKKVPQLLAATGGSRFAGPKNYPWTIAYNPNYQSEGRIYAETEAGWFAARPSGTEDVRKIYTESFRDAAHLRRIQMEGQSVIVGIL
jgi:phosphoglucomutase